MSLHLFIKPRRDCFSERFMNSWRINRLVFNEQMKRSGKIKYVLDVGCLSWVNVSTKIILWFGPSCLILAPLTPLVHQTHFIYCSLTFFVYFSTMFDRFCFVFKSYNAQWVQIFNWWLWLFQFSIKISQRKLITLWELSMKQKFWHGMDVVLTWTTICCIFLF